MKMDASSFKRTLTSPTMFDEYVRENVLMTPYRMTIKKKCEDFNGELRNRFYCINVESADTTEE